MMKECDEKMTFVCEYEPCKFIIYSLSFSYVYN